MNRKQIVSLVLGLLMITSLPGCAEDDKGQEIASPACADLDDVTDEAQRAELLKKCPRKGPDFKPSPKREW